MVVPLFRHGACHHPGFSEDSEEFGSGRAPGPLTSSLAAGPGHLVLTSFHSPLCVSCFPGSSLLLYFSCVCLGFQMLQLLVILVTIWVSQDMGRWWQGVGGRQWKNPILGKGKFHICFPGWIMGWRHGLNIVTKTDCGVK